MATKKKVKPRSRARSAVARGPTAKALKVEIAREDDGRFIAEIAVLPGVLAYGATRQEAIAHAKALALRVIAERIEHDEPLPSALGGHARRLTQVSFIEQPAA
jgi:predicted RNase H-like HicB family nuclease